MYQPYSLIEVVYPEIQLQANENIEERRFINENSLFSKNWKNREYINLVFPRQMELEYDNPNEIILNLQTNHVTPRNEELNYSKYSTFFSWEFFQLIKYPVSICIIINSLQKSKKKRWIRFFEQFPIGQIFEKGLDDIDSCKLIIKLNIRENVSHFF